MNLSDLLKEHGQYSTRGALSGNLGDGYLLIHNPIFRSIRRAVLKCGYKLTDRRFKEYDALSLTQLPHILKHKTIPYCNNVNALREIEKIAPRVFRWAEVPPLRSNYLMHESAHGIAHSLKSRFVKENQREVILSTLIEEAFANTCECLANVYASSEFHDEFLYKNSYIMESEMDREVLRKLLRNAGERSTFRLIFMAYLFANFQKMRPSEAEFERILKWVKIKPTAGVRRAFHIGLRLDPAFTMFTNAFCFRLMGVKQNLRGALDFDFLKMLEHDKRYQGWIGDLEKVISWRSV